MYNTDQMGLQLEIISGRTLTIRGVKKVFRQIQRPSAGTHSYTVQICMRADGILPEKLGVVLYEHAGAPQIFQHQLSEYNNLMCYWSRSGWMESEIACAWMNEVF